MPGPTTTRRDAFLLVALLFGQLLLMSASARSASGSSRLEGWWMGISSPFVAAAHMVGGGFHRGISQLRALVRAHHRNAVLEDELARLRAELGRHREASHENQRLRRLLGMRDDLAPGSIGATVVTAGLTDDTRMLVIDRGAADGVAQEQPVVAWGGVVGRVVSVGASHAKIRLLDDPSSGISGVVQRSRAHGMVVGRGEGALRMLYVPGFDDVALGDRVVSSGLDGIFPRGFGIGRVTSVRPTPDGSQIIRLVPEIDFRSLEDVLVLLEHSGGPLLESTGDAGETP